MKKFKETERKMEQARLIKVKTIHSQRSQGSIQDKNEPKV